MDGGCSAQDNGCCAESGNEARIPYQVLVNMSRELDEHIGYGESVMVVRPDRLRWVERD